MHFLIVPALSFVRFAAAVFVYSLLQANYHCNQQNNIRKRFLYNKTIFTLTFLKLFDKQNGAKRNSLHVDLNTCLFPGGALQSSFVRGCVATGWKIDPSED